MIVRAVRRAVVAGLDPPAWLCPAELERHAALRPRAAADFLAGRVALKAAFAAWEGGAGKGRRPAAWCVDQAAEGRPAIGSRPDLYCSLAHADGWGIGAVAAGPVGVDVERVRPRSAALLAHVADDAERGLVRGAGAGDDELLAAIWTIKEAVLKGLGVGISVAPRRVRIVARDGGRWRVIDPDEGVWTVATERVEDVWLAVATRMEHDGERGGIGWYQPAGVPTPGAGVDAGRAGG